MKKTLKILIIFFILKQQIVIAENIDLVNSLSSKSIFCYKEQAKPTHDSSANHTAKKITNNKEKLAQAFLITLKNTDLDIVAKSFKWLEKNSPKSLFPHLTYLISNPNPIIYRLIPEFIKKNFNLIPLNYHLDLCIYLVTTNHQTSKTRNILSLLKFYFLKNFISWQAYFFTLRTWVMDLEKWNILSLLSKKELEDNPVFKEFQKINLLDEQEIERQEINRSNIVYLKAPKKSDNSLEIYVKTTFKNPTFFKRWLDIKLPVNEITSSYFKNLFEVFLLLPQYQIISYEIYRDNSVKENLDANWNNTKTSMSSIGKLFHAFKQKKLIIHLTTPLGETKQLTEFDMFTTFKNGSILSFRLSSEAKLEIMKQGYYFQLCDYAA